MSAVVPKTRSQKRLRQNSISAEKPFRPKLNQLVRVRSASEIAKTLDADGRCEGMPFMPEMIALCDREFSVQRWANNVCIQKDGITFGALENCLVLDAERCQGNAHGDCQMGCAFLWKTQWLSSVDEPCLSTDTQNAELLSRRLVKLASIMKPNGLPIFRCQATQLSQIAKSRPKLDVARIRGEYDLNQVSVSGLVTDFCSTLLARATGRSGGLRGPCKNTPVRPLGLMVGDQVRVRSESEIVSTLDQAGKNRGLWFDPLMSQHCGREFEVTRVVNRFVCESTGDLIKTKVPSVVLGDLHCSGRTRRYCSRLLQFFWREIWLERITS